MVPSERGARVGPNGRLLLWRLSLLVLLIGLVISVACRDEIDEAAIDMSHSEPNQTEGDAPPAESDQAAPGTTAQATEQVEVIES